MYELIVKLKWESCVFYYVSLLPVTEFNGENIYINSNDKEPYYVHYICFDDTMVTAWLEMNILTVQLFMMLWYWLTRRFTDSITSINTSFFLYLMPSDRQDTALVTVAGGRGAPTSNLWPCCVMYLKETKAERSSSCVQSQSVILLSRTPENPCTSFIKLVWKLMIAAFMKVSGKEAALSNFGGVPW